MNWNDNDVKKALGDLPSAEYPKELKTATKAEYTTMIKTMKKDKKKSGCPLFVLMLVFKLTGFIAITSLLG